MEDLFKEIDKFKKNIDSELAHLDITEFIKAVALTPKEKKLAQSYIKKLKDRI